ncbi:hypothetical protein ACFLWZ_04515 [Chloroflexota bacterium]
MQEKQIIDKLDNIQKEQKKSGFLSNASFGLAISAVGTSGLHYTTRLEIVIACIVLVSIGLVGFIWGVIKWRLAKT